MNNNEVSAYIINALAKDEDIDDIILALCEAHSLTWQEAETLVKNIQLENEQAISKKKFPLLFLLALAIFIGGLGMAGYGIYTILSEITIIQDNLKNAQQLMNDLDALAILYINLKVILTTGSAPISFIFLGIGMIFGSLRGMQEAWSEILEW